MEGVCNRHIPALAEVADRHLVRCFLHSDAISARGRQHRDTGEGTGMSEQAKPLVEVRGLSKYYPVEKGMFRRVSGWVKAVDDVSFDIHPGETLGLVGESGSGKTTVGRCMLRALDPTAGEVWFHHEGRSWDMAALSQKELLAIRPYAQMILSGPLFVPGPAAAGVRHHFRTDPHPQPGQRHGTWRIRSSTWPPGSDSTSIT